MSWLVDGEELDGEALSLEDDPLVAPEPLVAPGEEEDEPDDGLVLLEEEDEPDGELGVAGLDGVLGVVVPDDAAPEPEREVVSPVPALSPHADSMLAPNARETIAARVESLISWPPWLG